MSGWCNVLLWCSNCSLWLGFVWHFVHTFSSQMQLDDQRLSFTKNISYKLEMNDKITCICNIVVTFKYLIFWWWIVCVRFICIIYYIYNYKETWNTVVIGLFSVMPFYYGLLQSVDAMFSILNNDKFRNWFANNIWKILYNKIIAEASLLE